MRILRLPGQSIAEKVKDNAVATEATPCVKTKVILTSCTIDLTNGSLRLPKGVDIEFVNCTFKLPQVDSIDIDGITMFDVDDSTDAQTFAGAITGSDVWAETTYEGHQGSG